MVRDWREGGRGAVYGWFYMSRGFKRAPRTLLLCAMPKMTRERERESARKCFVIAARARAHHANIYCICNAHAFQLYLEKAQTHAHNMYGAHARRLITPYKRVYRVVAEIGDTPWRCVCVCVIETKANVAFSKSQ